MRNSLAILGITFSAVLSLLLSSSVIACDRVEKIQLLKPVELSAELRTEFQAMAPLKVVAVNAPPLSHYDEKTQTYHGVGIDIFHFIAKELGLNFEIIAERDQTVTDKIRQVQEGRADVFIPLSYSEKRAQHGLFTNPYYESYYVVIALNNKKISIRHSDDLAKYQVGLIEGVSLQPILETIVPPTQLHAYNPTTSDPLFQAVRNGSIDVAIFNQQIFTEKRYNQEYLDLEIIHKLHEYPRDYGYYFSQSPEHERIVEAFNLYLSAIDISESVIFHERGERNFFERYITQRNQRTLLLVAVGATVLLSLITSLGLLRYRRMSQLLTERTKQLETLSQTDSLTGLANRRHFDVILNYEYQRYQRTGQPLSLLLLDLDHFKCVNDHYGHAVGDDYLRTIATTLKKQVARSTDLVARYGGEEFVCLLTDTAPEGAINVAKRISHEVAKLRLPNVAANPPYVTLSIGVATVINGDPGIKELFTQADSQLYIAKNLGRNKIRATMIENKSKN